MGLIVPNALEVEVLQDKLNTALTLRLFGNNITPTGINVAADFTEISGGGYAAKALAFANWVITAGDPSIALYNAIQQWTFTGAVAAPGTVYGYYITRNSDGKLIVSERFSATVLPFSPIVGSAIGVIPKITATSQY